MNPLLISDDPYENQLQEEYDAARAWAIACEDYQRRHPLIWSGDQRPHSVNVEDILEFGVHDLDTAHGDASVKLQRLRAYRAAKT